ncbi:Asp-tRNA(Asn)/Glu-tRNA(Gln) amidotransferase subunit GatB [Patescibacteria group bacterium]|nr:Asp-tRNA(Asn)/Glu-tRNA(Gln) amidotransferase subunit GatB [Patescibacteria group bacterium]
MSTYTPTIGLEIHAELKTKTKMFCGSKNDPEETRPNVNICPICMAFPGTLPVANREAVKHVLRVGAAINGTLADYTEFDRKNYFYPDLPKGYQISQYQYPLISGGEINNVAVTRIHLEEDTARSQHTGDGYSIIDFNRAGVPLMELVTEPVIHDAQTASAFAKELQLLLRALGAGEANMEKGQMRVEANISVSKTEKLGTKVEVKNLNSFRSVERAIAYEIERQTALLEEGGTVIQETRGWDEKKEQTYSQRLKEDSHDYRYFPDPDIPKFRLSLLSEFTETEIRKTLPALPWERRAKLISLGIAPEDVEVFVADEAYSPIYTSIIEPIQDEKTRRAAINLLLNDVRGKNPSLEQLSRIAGGLFEIATMFAESKISSAGAKAIIAELFEREGIPSEIAKAKGLMQVSDAGAMSALAEEIIREHAKVAEEVKGGKAEAMKFLLGQGMRKSKGSANPAELERVIKEKLGL